jgi:hypothetical protein
LACAAEACTCSHAEAGLRAALALCGSQAGAAGEELVQALTLQTAAQAEALSAAEQALAAAEEARAAAEGRAAASQLALDEIAATGGVRGAGGRAARARLRAAAERASEREAALQRRLSSALAAAEDGARRAARASARLSVSEAEVGLLTAERAVCATKLTVAEESLVSAAVDGGGSLGVRVEAIRAASASDARAAADAVERARRAVADSVRRADAAFSASGGARSAQQKGMQWQSRLELAGSRDAVDGGGSGRGEGGGGGLRSLRRGAGRALHLPVRVAVTLLWRLRYVVLLLALAGGVALAQTATEEGVGGGLGLAAPAATAARELEPSRRPIAAATRAPAAPIHLRTR